MTSCPACAGPMVRNGVRRIVLKDLDQEGDGALEREIVLQRHLCRGCGSIVQERCEDAHPTRRMTSALHDEIVRRLATESVAAVSSRFGVDRKRVASILREGGSTLGAVHPVHAEMLVEERMGREATIVLDLSTGVIAHRFPGVMGPVLMAWLGAHPGGSILVDRRHAGVVRSVPPTVSITCSRHSMLEWLDERLPSIMAKARSWLDRGGRSRLREIAPILRIAPPMRSPTEDLRVAEARAADRILDDLVRTVDGFRSIWSTSLRKEGRRRLEAWRNSLTTFGKEAMSEALALVTRIDATLFGPEHALSRPSGRIAPTVQRPTPRPAPTPNPSMAPAPRPR